MAILLGIDGTGEYSDEEYRRSMRNSFVSYVYRHSPTGPKRYMRGPGMDGLDMAIIAAEGEAFVQYSLAGRPADPVLLMGYSRGGAGVIAVAQRLQRRGIPVEAMILFDAVDRSITIDTEVIPGNVVRVYHARRDPASFSRRSFANTGTRHTPPTVYEERYFYCTHGGVGGVHWTGGRPDEVISEAGEATPTFVTYSRDLRGAQEVWRWVQPFLRQHGFL